MIKVIATFLAGLGLITLVWIYWALLVESEHMGSLLNIQGSAFLDLVADDEVLGRVGPAILATGENGFRLLGVSLWIHLATAILLLVCSYLLFKSKAQNRHHGSHIGHSPNKGFNRTPESSGPAKPGESGGGAG